MKKWLTVTVLDPEGCIVGHVYGTSDGATYEEKGEANRGQHTPGTYPQELKAQLESEPLKIRPVLLDHADRWLSARCRSHGWFFADRDDLRTKHANARLHGKQKTIARRNNALQS